VVLAEAVYLQQAEQHSQSTLTCSYIFRLSVQAILLCRDLRASVWSDMSCGSASFVRRYMVPNVYRVATEFVWTCIKWKGNIFLVAYQVASIVDDSLFTLHPRSMVTRVHTLNLSHARSLLVFVANHKSFQLLRDCSDVCSEALFNFVSRKVCLVKC
jgi:hypothetical protein